MTGAMYAAVSGLRTHMQFMNVIGNNISNVNTAGYKAARYIFNEALYTNVKSGSNSTMTRGGTNPAQIGYGTGVGTIDLDMSTKNFRPAGRAILPLTATAFCWWAIKIWGRLKVQRTLRRCI